MKLYNHYCDKQLKVYAILKKVSDRTMYLNSSTSTSSKSMIHLPESL